MGERLDSVDAIVDRYARRIEPGKRKLFVFIGIIFVICAIIGVFIPGSVSYTHLRAHET